MFQLFGKLRKEAQGKPIASVRGGIEDFLEKNRKLSMLIRELLAEWINQSGGAETVMLQDHARVCARL